MTSQRHVRPTTRRLRLGRLRTAHPGSPRMRTAELAMYFWILQPHASYTNEVDNAVEFLRGPFAYTIVLLFEQRNLSQLQT